MEKPNISSKERYELYMMSISILVMSIVLAYQYQNLYLLGVIGHTFLFLRLLYPTFEENKIYILIGHFLLVIGFGMRLDKRYHGHIIPSIIGSIAHSLFFANFLKNVFNIDNRNIGKKHSPISRYMYLLTGVANLGLSTLYYITYAKGNCNIDDKYENIENIITIFSLSVISVFFLSKIYEDRNNYKLFANVIMSVYYTKSLSTKIL